MYDGNRLNNGLLTLTGTGDLFFNTENVREFLLRLNLSMIDVDRLDYIMRDMQMSGFEGMSIDIERLLESVILFYDIQKQEYKFGYKKNALSTIENVIVAYDSERRWIQSHPVVMYDSFLVKKCIDAVEKQFKEKKRRIIIVFFRKNL